MAERIVIADLELNTQGLIADAQKTRAEISALRAENAELKKSGEENSAQFIRNEAEIKRLSPVYNNLQKAIAAQVDSSGKLVSVNEKVNQLLSTESVTIAEARAQNAQLLAIKQQLNPAIAAEAAQLEALNKKYDDNTAFIKSNSSATEQQKMAIGDYKNQIVEAANEMNPFNGGIAGFTQRAQAAGGVLPLLTTGLTGVIAGIRGMTMASLTFLATPIGAAIGLIAGALALVFNYLKNTQGGMDKLTSVTRPLQAIFQSLGTLVQKVGEWLVNAFSNPKKTLMELGDFLLKNIINRFKAFAVILDGIINLDFKKTANGVAQLGTGVENMTDKLKGAAQATNKFLSDAAKRGQEIDRLNKEIEKSQIAFERNAVKYNDIIDEQKEISKDTSRSFAEREAAARKIIAASQAIGDEEAAIIQKRIDLFKLEIGLRQATREEQKKMAELETQLDAAQDRGHDAELENMKIISGLKKERAAEEKQRADEAARRAEEAAQKAIELQKLQLDEYLLLQGTKAKSVEDEIAQARRVYDEKVKIAQAEFNASKQTENDKVKLRIATATAGIELSKAQADAVTKNANDEYQKLLAQNKEFLKEGELLNNAKVEQEKQRIQNIADAEADRIRATVENEQMAADQVKAIYQKLAEDKTAIDVQYTEQENARKLTDLENKRAINSQNFFVDLQLQGEQDAIKMEQELVAAEKSGADQQLIRDKYAELDKQRTQAVADYEYNTRSMLFGGLKSLFGEQSKLGKVFALAEIVNTTVQNATKAFTMGAVLSANPLTAPLAANAYIQGGIIVATGAAQAAKVVGAKFEKGGLMEVGGNRHSAGGTKFVGSDGTRFEAEQGELIGVMSRPAASHFMAFNNAFTSGRSSGNYFANGGIVSREMASPGLSADELAMKIAEANRSIPAPVVAVEDILSKSNSVVQVREAANF